MEHALTLPLSQRESYVDNEIHFNSLTRMFLNSTRVPWPSKPIRPVVRARPGWAFEHFGVGHVLVEVRVDVTLPFTVTLMCRPLTTISSSFHSPIGLSDPGFAATQP